MKRLTHVEQIESPKIRRLFLYWQSKCSTDSIPQRQGIKPEELADILPNLLLVEFEQSPFRVRFRLVGTKVVEVTGYEFTGKYLDEIAATEDRQPFHECYEIASKSEAPIITHITWRFDEDTTGDYDFCVLPLESDGRVATMAVAIECYDRLRKRYV